MCIIAAAFNHAVKHIVIHDDGKQREVQLLKYAVPVLYKEEVVSRLTSKTESSPRSWMPTWQQVALFIDTIGRQTSKGEWNKNSENLYRYVIIAPQYLG